MGGNIAWIVRKEDGEVVKMERWTNVMPWIHRFPKFLEGSPEGFHEVTKDYFDMLQDYEENKETGNFRNNMTEVYCSEPAMFAPSEYGLIFTDFVTKTIHSYQHYTRLGDYQLFSIRMRHQEDIDELQALIDAGYISEIQEEIPYDEQVENEFYRPLDISPITELYYTVEKEDGTIEKIQCDIDLTKATDFLTIFSGWRFLRDESIKSGKIPRNIPGCIKLTFGNKYPFKIENYEEGNVEEGKRFMKNIQDFGIIFTSDEEAYWAEYFKYHSLENDDETE